jgi:hypothetical protein
MHTCINIVIKLTVHATTRLNEIDAAEWHAIMDDLATITSITSLNGVDGLGELFAGGQTEVVLSGKNLAKAEAAVAVSRLLLRSETTLTKLDLR